MNKKILTLCVVYTDTHILLGMKKHGFGEGRWNGFGGKVEEGETIEKAALRELLEETGLDTAILRKRGILRLIGETKNPLEVHLFSADSFMGEPRETDEVTPQWFFHADIPYNFMWPDDKHWLPLVLGGKNIEGTFHFKDTAELFSYEVKEV